MSQSKLSSNKVAAIERQRSSNPWLTLFGVFVAGLAAAATQYQIPPVVSLLRESMGISPDVVGLIMSCFAVAGAVAVIGSASVIQRLGLRRTALYGITALSVGNLIGVAYHSSIGIIVGRLIGGLGLGLVSVAAPTLISQAFSGRELGLPMGIWATWMPFGAFIVYNLSSLLVREGSTVGVWWFCFLLSLAGLVGVYLATREFAAPAPVQAGGPRAAERVQGTGTVRAVLRNRQVVLLSVIFLVYCAVYVSFKTWYPTFLVQRAGFTLSAANFYSSLIPIVTMIGSPIFGRIYDRFRAARLIGAATFAVQIALFLAAFQDNHAAVLPVVLATGLMAGAVPVVVMAAIPEVLREGDSLAGGLSLAMIAQHVGVILGPVLLGSAIRATGSWHLVGIILILMCVLGCGLWVLLPSGRSSEVLRGDLSLCKGSRAR
ncbi:MAG: CynX/NimT family MFS transporter [Moorellaceae bacterium]